jgi:hypothetical protein
MHRVNADDLAVVADLERELQTAACRHDPHRMRALLADDFEEVGASGRIWTLTTALGLVASETADEPEIEVHDLVTRAVTDDTVMVRWDSARGHRRARRTSLWRRDPDGWRLVHHQGTPLPD